eukprot:JP437877.1.p2 GENE.JP437877.1~~JP437877.1.p2  ORF type:complete len:82 (+),score=5.86 JP437877.1:61-306(+)
MSKKQTIEEIRVQLSHSLKNSNQEKDQYTKNLLKTDLLQIRRGFIHSPAKWIQASRSNRNKCTMHSLILQWHSLMQWKMNA